MSFKIFVIFYASLMLDSSPKPIENMQKYHKKNSSVVFTLFPNQQESLKISRESQAALRFLTQLCIILKLEAFHQTSGACNLNRGQALGSAPA